VESYANLGGATHGKGRFGHSEGRFDHNEGQSGHEEGRSKLDEGRSSIENTDQATKQQRSGHGERDLSTVREI